MLWFSPADGSRARTTQSKDYEEKLPFEIDPKLGVDSSAFAWALEVYHVFLKKNRAAYQERLNQAPSEAEARRLQESLKTFSDELDHYETHLNAMLNHFEPGSGR